MKIGNCYRVSINGATRAYFRSRISAESYAGMLIAHYGYKNGEVAIELAYLPDAGF